MPCEATPIGGGIMRCRRCKIDWLENTGKPVTCLDHQSKGTPYQSIVDVPDYGLMKVQD